MIHLPKDLVDAIHSNVDFLRGLNAIDLRANYQENKNHQHLHQTYLMSRMPATYAAILKVLDQIPAEIEVKTVLDIGCGPGTGLWASKERFNSIVSYVGVENDRRFIQLAQALNEGNISPKTQWIQGLYPKKLPAVKADLVLMSYTLGENSQVTIEETINQVWENNVGEWLVLIEPGTPKGFKGILESRGYITKNEGYICAPCKGSYVCPLSGQDWCHFSVRLERTELQKKIKSATLPYEDEKFSYIIARKTPIEFEETDARIIKKPLTRPGHITLDLCSKDPYERITVSKSRKAEYPKAKRAEWGDSWNKDSKND